MMSTKGLERKQLRSTVAPKMAAPRPVAAAPATGSPVQTVGFYIMLIYLFLAFSRVLDVMGQGLRVPLIFYILMLVMALLSGSLLTFLKTGVGRWLCAFAIWVGITFPFSTWRGGSVDDVVNTYRAFVFAIVIIGLTVSIPQTFSLLRMIAYSILGGALLSFVYGLSDYGRLTIAVGTFRDPNQYAMTMLYGVPFWLWMAKALPFPLKLAPYICLGPIFVAFLKAGSRGGAIGLAAFCLVIFLQASIPRKALLLVVFAAVTMASLAFLPDYLKERYFTIFSADPAQVSNAKDREMLEGADVGSSHARLTLLLDSIQITVMNPIFGVGPGQFGIVNWERRKKAGLPKIYNVTHNTYTQISSELGIPGFIIFIGLLFSCFRAVRSVARLQKSPIYRPPPLVIDAANYLFLGLVVLTVCAFFLSLAYGTLFYVMAAVIAVFQRAVQNDLPSWRIGPVPVVTPPPERKRFRVSFAVPGSGTRLARGN